MVSHMKRRAWLWGLLALSFLLSGCWTFGETEYPQASLTAAPKTHGAIALSGFESFVTDYEAVQGFRTVYVPGHHGRHYCSPGYFESVPCVDYIPQRHSSDMFLRRAQDAFEQAGFVLTTDSSACRVDVSFEGPYAESGEIWKTLGWTVGTLFFCTHDAMRWTARLRIRDGQTGRLLFHRDLTQSYSVGVFGLIPLFGPFSCDKISAAQMQSWCLSALTDRACAEASAFLAAER